MIYMCLINSTVWEGDTIRDEMGILEIMLAKLMVWWYMRMMPLLSRQRQVDLEFKVTLSTE